MNAFNFNRVPCLALRGVGRPTIFDFLNIDPGADIFQPLRGFLCPGLVCLVFPVVFFGVFPFILLQCDSRGAFLHGFGWSCCYLPE
jgi:hypothetical protein